MSKTFRDWEPDQVWLLPPSIQDVMPAGHVAHFVRETVRTGLDLSAILAGCAEERGYPPYHPGMMVALLKPAPAQAGGTEIKANASKHKACPGGGRRR